LGLISIPLTSFTYETYKKIIIYSYAKIITENNQTTEIITDDSGIPIVDYKIKNGYYIGKQYNPVTISQHALNSWQKYRHCSKIQ
jgi:hypothetical protein